MNTKANANTTESLDAQPSKHWEAPAIFLLSDIVKNTEASGPDAGTVDGTYSTNAP